jgi:hypothetical protein
MRPLGSLCEPSARMTAEKPRLIGLYVVTMQLKFTGRLVISSVAGASWRLRTGMRWRDPIN